MIHTSIKADTTLRDAHVAVEIAQYAHDKALRLSRTQEQSETQVRLKAAVCALMLAQNKARRNG